MFLVGVGVGLGVLRDQRVSGLVCWRVLPVDQGPGLPQSVDGVGLQGRQDGPERREVLQSAALL